MAGAMVEWLDDGDRAATGYLPGQHQFEARQCLLWDGGGHAQNVLHRIAVAQAIALAVVDQAGGPRPGEGDEAVVEAPYIDRVVEILVRRLNRQAAEAGMPGLLEFLQFDGGAFERAVLRHGALAHHARVADAEHHQHLPALARLQRQRGVQRPAGIVTVSMAVAALPSFHCQRVVIAAVPAEERFAAGVVAGQRRADQRHPRLVEFVVQQRFLIAGRQVVLDRNAQQVVVRQ